MQDSSLSVIEAELNSISGELFEEDPRRFKTLHHVISVLAASTDDSTDLEANEAYKHLKRQHAIVQNGIETVTKLHYRELNAGVVGLEKVSEDFTAALAEVRRLRRQVKAVKGSLENDLHRQTPEASSLAASNSLRDLYAKKKECQAVLGILEKVRETRVGARSESTNRYEFLPSRLVASLVFNTTLTS